jgi:ZIP family zinc transporter
MELLFDSLKLSGLFPAAVGFIAGSLMLFILDFLLPHKHIVSEKGVINAKMFRTGTLMVIGISLHNLPEGIAVASGYSYAPEIGLIVTIAIALHNIPEGIAIAMPIRMSGAPRWTAFRTAFLSGLAEPVGAGISAVFLTTLPELMPFALSFAAGVMVFITMDELIPIAHEHGHEHFTSFGLIMVFILTFGCLLQFLRQGLKEAGISQRKLAEFLETDQASISRKLRGKRPFRYEEISAITYLILERVSSIPQEPISELYVRSQNVVNVCILKTG